MAGDTERETLADRVQDAIHDAWVKGAEVHKLATYDASEARQKAVELAAALRGSAPTTDYVENEEFMCGEHRVPLVNNGYSWECPSCDRVAAAEPRTPEPDERVITARRESGSVTFVTTGETPHNRYAPIGPEQIRERGGGSVSEREYGRAFGRTLWWRYDLTAGAAWVHDVLHRRLRFYGITVGRWAFGAFRQSDPEDAAREEGA